MIKLIASFNKHSGPNVTGEHRIVFDIQKEHAPLLYPHLQTLEEKPYMVIEIHQISSKEEADERIKETEEERWKRNNKKIHAMFDELAEMKKLKSDEVKTTIKEKLKKEGTIKESLKELSIEQQLRLIDRLDNVITPLLYENN